MAKIPTVSFNGILKAHDRVSKYIHKTPVFTSSYINNQTGRQIYFKAENLQKTGSFKARGALNAILKLKAEKEIKGVVTHSSGNHGQAVAWASSLAGLPSSVVVAADTPDVKTEAITDHGAELVKCGLQVSDRHDTCAKVSAEKGFDYISSCDNSDVISGQGTIALEFLEQVPGLDAILVPVSGGGMIAGIAVAAKHLTPDIKIFAVEAEGKELEKCLRSGKRLWPNPPQYVDTIAEGIRLQQLGHVSWPIVLEHVEKQVFTVNNDQIKAAMKIVFQRMKLVIEAASGAGVAALLSDQFKHLDNKIQKVGVILCGGNVDVDHLPWLPQI